MIDRIGDIKITDFHSHILPEMDDGSRDAEESIEMLKVLRSQGVDRVVLTPHFYPDEENPRSFLSRRARSAETLRRAIEDMFLDENCIPEICIGAEVAYFNGMSMYKKLRELCIVGTNVMLLEMPFYEWTDVVVNEVCKIQMEFGIQVVLAHVDRYGKYADNAKLSKLKSNRVMMQINADPFLSLLSAVRCQKLLRSKFINVMGSDCHNLTSRPSNIDKAIDVICSKGGMASIKNIMQTADELLERAENLM